MYVVTGIPVPQVSQVKVSESQAVEDSSQVWNAKSQVFTLPVYTVGVIDVRPVKVVGTSILLWFYYIENQSHYKII